MTAKKDQMKKIAAEKAVSYLKSNSIIGLGTGSTVYFALELISKLIADNKLVNIKGIPSSKATEELAVKFNIPLTSLDENPFIDINIDGADEVDSDLYLIKGGGGALLKEKIIAQASKTNIIMVDESKLSNFLGERFYLPVEVFPFAIGSETEFIKKLGMNPKIRIKNNSAFITDQGNYIIDIHCGKIQNVKELSDILHSRAGIAEHGLFIDLTNILVIGKESGAEIKFNKNI
ncbi:MAG: ribose 5-phosphate isomerase A [Ignavibacteriales bacterium CG_4_9_14_3_um_filter_34_10]|nr:MAG: ribose 5-phosphate isomerase A [Ignavibacteriales bacterium CG_4_9_14_3_um_filter_34_10]